uniref:Uncharacterized protein n=1 Tax=Rhizophora mucronata TaxID=61149 RepID=A0A2P2J509_RHIMU
MASFAARNWPFKFKEGNGLFSSSSPTDFNSSLCVSKLTFNVLVVVLAMEGRVIDASS